jgi:hypothetical protein
MKNEESKHFDYYLPQANVKSQLSKIDALNQKRDSSLSNAGQMTV